MQLAVMFFQKAQVFFVCVQMLMYVILGAPIIIAADIRVMEKWAIDLYTATEVLAIDQDPGECTTRGFSALVPTTT